MTQGKHNDQKDIIRYELEHKGTEAGTGWFAPMPVGQVDFEDGLAYMKGHPNDEFLHRYMLNTLGSFGPNLTEQLIERGLKSEPLLAALMYEACYLNERFRPLTKRYEGCRLEDLAQQTPLIYIRWILNKGTGRDRDWLAMFAENIIKHQPLVAPTKMVVPLPYDKDALGKWEKNAVSIAQLYPSEDKHLTEKKSLGRPPAEIARIAQKKLDASGLQRSSENANPASINPLGLQMKWHMNVHVESGRHRYGLSGLQTSYGKGLTPEAARASCLMEVCERVSSFASFEADRTVHYQNGHSLILSRFEDLAKQNIHGLDPNGMHLEIPYENQPLYWMPAESLGGLGTQQIHVPAQLVFLFCNLDETCLSDGMPSTGLASGNMLEEAKLSALLEIIERDSERVMPYLPERCFTLEADDPLVRDVLARAKDAGLQVRFLDITTELGVPCYKAFIQSPNGDILKGSAAHLDGKRAAVSSLLEVPFHSSWFKPVPEGTAGEVRQLEDLPNYATGSAEQDLERLERLLLANGYGPIYVDLMREDLQIPVIKAMLPGLEFFPEFDRFSTLSLRQLGHYVKAFC